jgi:hypothetical protein
MIYTEHTVYRVNWMRAKARADRWAEELQIVKKEMEWTRNWFERQAEDWRKRSEKACRDGMRGHACYAEKQQTLWVGMRKQAESAFGSIVGL